MTRPDPTAEQLARDRLHAVAQQRQVPTPPRAAPVTLEAGEDAHPGRRRARHRTAPSVGAASSVAGPPAGAARAGAVPADALPADAPAEVWQPATRVPWLPVRPPDVTGGVPPPPEVATVVEVRTAGDVRDVAVRGRAEALAAAAAGYSEAYGHPLDHPGEVEPTGPRRWWLSTRHAVVAGIAVAVLAAGVVVRASTDVPDAPVDIGTSAVTGTDPREGPAGSPAGPVAGSARVPGGGVGGPGGATGGTSGAGAAGAPGGGSPATGPAAGVAGAGGGAGGPGAAGSVVVHVVGQVPTPGVLTLPVGSRVGDAVAAAGGAGPAADLSAVNLARVVVDGEQVHVPAHGEPARPAPDVGGDPGAGGGSGTGGAVSPVDVNTADLSALDTLPGIGPVLAQRIVDWRTDNGPFRTVEELGEVSGIGEALLSRLRPLVRV